MSTVNVVDDALSTANPTPLESLRDEVRAVIADAGVQAQARCDAWLRGHDLEFTRVLAERGLIGITWPSRFGGRDASNLERLVLTEELLRAGAPVAAHWIADRQIGPAILRYGSEELQREYLPRITSGKVTFCLGMSETESGSDLAAVRTRAIRDGETFRITGRKIWTSHAHRSTHAYVLARSESGQAKHEGLTEFVVDLSSPGVDVRPIYDLGGEHHFNEVTFDDVVVPVGNVIGEIGNGWRQVTSQLAFERGGMERVLSSYPLLAAVMSDPGADADAAGLGALVARLHSLRAMACRVAEAMDAGEAPVQRSAVLKFLGTAFEGDVVEFARTAVGTSPDPDAAGPEGLLAAGILAAPGATLRGGATEVLLTIVGRSELAAGSGRTRSADSDELRAVVDEVLGAQPRQQDASALGQMWDTAVRLGWTGVGVPESVRGSGGTIADLAHIAAALARHGYSAPIVETALAGRIRANAGKTFDGARPLVPALGSSLSAETRGTRLVLNGRLPKVAWARCATSLVAVASAPDGELLIEVPLEAPGLSVEPGKNLAGEPRDAVELLDVSVPTSAVLGGQAAVDAARTAQAVLQSAATVGALEAALVRAREYASMREQFGKPLAAFQAVAHNIARMAADVALAEVAVEQGLADVETDLADCAGWRAAVARIVTARAATAVAKTAHQVLGAMGTTREHDLHLATLRLWAWRDESVAQKTLERRLGSAALAAGPDAMWDWCVEVSDELGDDTWTPWREL